MFELFITPIFLDIVFDIQSMWFFHVKLSSISIPVSCIVFVQKEVVLSSYNKV